MQVSKQTEMVLARIGDHIKKGRQNAGMSQMQLAEASGLHRTYISDVERGIRNLSIGSIITIFNALKLEPCLRWVNENEAQ